MYLIIMFKCGHFHYYNSFSYQVKHPKTKRYLRGEFQFLTIWSILKQTQKIAFLVLLISSELTLKSRLADPKTIILVKIETAEVNFRIIPNIC